MDSKQLANAVRNMSRKIYDAIENTDRDATQCQVDMSYDALNDCAELLRCLSRVIEGRDVQAAFGSPGDWGYGSPIANALVSMG